MTTSTAGSASTGFRDRWTRVAKRDTAPEAAAVQNAWFDALTNEQCADWWWRWHESLSSVRHSLIKKQHPGASDREVMALWVEETYRGRADTDPAWLAKACAAIRAGEAGAAVDACAGS